MKKRLRKEKIKGKNKKAQTMQMPFGMIFSILLIAVFIVVAFIAIKYFLKMRNCSQINIFVDDLQKKIDSVWRQTSVSGEEFSLNLPSGIKYVCLADLNKTKSGEHKNLADEFRGDFQNNLFFYPPRKACGRPSVNIEHINLTGIIKDKNPYCFENTGKVSMALNKKYNEAFVEISKTLIILLMVNKDL